MPTYAYSGRDPSLKSVTGVLEGASPAQVAESLAGMGIVPLVIEPYAPKASAQDTFSGLFRRNQIKPDQLLLMTRQLHTLMRAGVPILKALRGLEVSATHDGLRTLYRELLQALDEGLELSQALARRKDVFDPFFISMVRVGETTGRLSEIFLNLHDHLDFQRYMREQVASALRYPKFVCIAMIIAMVVINIMVIPAFAKVFANMKTELPLMTRILLGTSDFMVNWWPLLLLIAGAAGFGAKMYVATAEGRWQWDRLKLSLPIAGKVIRKGTLSRACRSLGLVLHSGVPVLNGLALTADVVDNVYLERALREMRTSIDRGESVLMASTRAAIFTPIVLQMVSVGEETGNLDEMLDEVGRMYQREVEYELKTMSQQIEPILILVLGAMVLVLALGVFMPMWDLGKAALK